jgi:ATP-dependent helicase/nuclease subunit A
LDREAKSLLERHPQNRLNEQVVRASSEILTALAKKSTLSIADVPAENRRLLEKEARHGVKGWTADEVARANAIARAARRFLQLDPGFMETLCRLLIPFARHCREGFVRQGLISFDALLVRARDLLRDHVGVRQELKAQYRALLIDEFQDTDPIQYEILLYLAERPDRAATEWRGIELTPGKIFVVGDPKQSIYAFRRADIEAYLRVVDELIKAQGGIECNLSTNFRSHAGILGVVNGLFERLIRPQPGLQPAYVAIHPRPDGQLESPERPPGGVLLRLLASDDGPMDARSARTVEAESLARWLAEEVFPRITLPDGEGKAQPARPRDVAILFRKLTHVYPYLDALRRWDIPYVVEGERHFYSAPEIIDAINLLRAIEDPHDRAALVGLLRSPLGGLDDREIYELSEAGLLDYRAAARLPKSSPARAVYAPLASLHERVGTLPVAEALLSVFASFPIRVLAAHSSRGEQAVANVDKLRHQILLLGPQATFKEIVANLRRRVEEVQEESEGALAEENLDAVRILSIHKAKGLEFPMVVIAGVHAGVEEQEQALVDYDWTTGLVGIHVGGHWNLPGIFLAENRRLRVREEQKRLFYVAMTRAKEHLTLSGASGARKSPGSFLAMLEEGLGDGLVNLEESGTIAVGSALIEHRRVRETPRPPTRPTREGGAPRVFDSSAYASLWEAREAARRAIMNTPRFTNPTALARADLARKPAGSRKRRKSRSPDRAALLGELTHRFLARWDFSAPARGLDSEVELFLNSAGNPGLAAERATVEKEMRKILRRFFSSDAYAEFADARILAREAPFLIDWNGQIMEGVIDVLFENDEGLFIGDYKTDDVRRRDLRDRAKSYRHQVKAYAEAARRSLKRDVAGCKIIFLRLGEAIEVPLL